MTGPIIAARMTYPSRVSEFIPLFSGLHVAQSIAFCVVFYKPLWFFLSFSFFQLTASDYPFSIFNFFFYILKPNYPSDTLLVRL
jgi:hypothetical protein